MGEGNLGSGALYGGMCPTRDLRVAWVSGGVSVSDCVTVKTKRLQRQEPVCVCVCVLFGLFGVSAGVMVVEGNIFCCETSRQ